MQIIPVSQQRASPWKNGQGVSWHIAADPDGASFEDFTWRVSRAAIMRNAPFSAFPDTERWITLIQGQGCTLRFTGGGALMLRKPFVPMRFDGALEAECRLAAGPCTVLNVMARRGRAEADVAVLPDAGDLPPDIGDAARDGNTILVRLDPGLILRVRFR